MRQTEGPQFDQAESELGPGSYPLFDYMLGDLGAPPAPITFTSLSGGSPSEVSLTFYNTAWAEVDINPSITINASDKTETGSVDFDSGWAAAKRLGNNRIY